MTIFRSAPKIRSAKTADYSNLVRFLNHESKVHRHLDWRAPLEWLGNHPFLIAEQESMIHSVFACPPDPKDFAWIRLFASSGPFSRDYYFRRLMEAALEELRETGSPQIVAIGLQPWFQKILLENGFINRQNIVVLEWSGHIPPETILPEGIHIRSMVEEDLPQVQRVDNAAFEPLWQNSLESLTLAYNQSACSTVAETSSAIVGYQISTSIPLSGHLARLAVLPGMQRGHIGYALVRDLMGHFTRQGAWRVTVNTQDNNYASLALYEKMGFHRTGEQFPVYEHAVY